MNNKPMSNRETFLFMQNENLQDEKILTMEDIEKYSDEWLWDLFDMYIRLGDDGELYSHPDYQFNETSWKTTKWNVSWIHADLCQKNRGKYTHFDEEIDINGKIII